MSDSTRAYIVHLASDIKDYVAEDTLKAFRMIKHVTKVTPVVADADMLMATERAKYELRQKIWQLLEAGDDS